MNPSGRNVLPSHEHVTAAAFRSATRDDAAPSGLARAAAGASLLLGALLLVVLPALAEAAFYVGVLALAAAAVAIVAGGTLWSNAGLVARASTVLAAAATVLAELIQIFVGLPGARGLSQLSQLGNLLALGLAGAVLVFLALDARRRTPESGADHPYAL